jgi:uncharacterized membrane protein YeaQ/YmgE (transglycosylase-associated protein family)
MTPDIWLEFVVTIVVGTVGGVLAGGLVNKWQGDDWRKSAKGGLLSGLIGGVFACMTVLAMAALKGGGA